MTTAIIGSGCAAVECILALRENGYNSDIHLFSDSELPSYNPMLTTYYASGKIDYDKMFPYGFDHDVFEKNDVIMHLGSKVLKLDTEKKTILNERGEKIKYDQALIATGASPVVPCMQGSQDIEILTVRTVEDAVKLKEAADSDKKRVLVVGASMVGIKVVEIFHNKGFDVCLADMAPNIFPMAAHPNCSQLIEEKLKKMGIKLAFDDLVTQVEKTDDGIITTFKNQLKTEVFDHIVMCIGVRANTEFIDKDMVDVDRGVLVDNHMKTNCDGLYSAGDVAQGNNILTNQQQVIGLWMNARMQGRTAGMNMAGVNEKYNGSMIHNITHYFDVDFIGAGDVKNGDYIFEKCDGDRYIRLVFNDNKQLTGFNILNDHEISGVLKSYLIKNVVSNTDDYKDGEINHSYVLNRIYRVYPELEKIIKERRCLDE